jgi:hypothetical protein
MFPQKILILTRDNCVLGAVLFLILTLAFVASKQPYPKSSSGYFPLISLRSYRAAIVNTAEYGGVQLHFDNSSCLKSLYLLFK